MVDFARFGIELIDKVSQPARRAADELDRVEKKLKQAKTLTALTNKEVQLLASNKVAGAVEGAFSRAASSVVKWGSYGVAAAGAASVAVGAMVTQSVVGMGMFADASRRAFSSLAGDAAKGTLAFDHAVDTAKQLGLNVQTTVGQYQKLLAMQFTLAEADDQVKLAADLQAVGTSAENTQRALIAMTQIKAKGKLQAEELVGQLAEAGVATTLVYGALAKQLGKTEAEVKKLISAGKVTADQGISAIKSAIMAKVHEHAPGEAAKAFSQSTLSGMMQRMQAAPNRLWLRVAEGISASLARMGPLMSSIERYIDNIDAKQIGDFVVTILEAVQQLVPLAMEFANGFGEGFREVVAGMQGFSTSKDDLMVARDMGRGFAKALGLVAQACVKIVAAISWLGSPMGQLVAKVVFWGTAGVKIVSSITAVVKAIGLIRQGMQAAAALSWAHAAGQQAAARAAAQSAASAAAEAEARLLGGALGGDWKGAAAGGIQGPMQEMAKKQQGFWSRMRGHAGRFFKNVGGWIVGLGPLVWGWLTPIGGWITGTLWPALVTGAQAVAGIFTGISLALTASITAAVASWAYAGYVAYKNWDDLKRSFTYLWDECVKKAEQLGGAIAQAFKNGFSAVGRFLMTGSFDESSGQRGLAPALRPPTLSPQAAAAVSKTQHVNAEINMNISAGQGADGKQIGEQAASTLKDRVGDMFEHAKLAMGV